MQKNQVDKTIVAEGANVLPKKEVKPQSSKNEGLQSTDLKDIPLEKKSASKNQNEDIPEWLK